MTLSPLSIFFYLQQAYILKYKIYWSHKVMSLIQDGNLHKCPISRTASHIILKSIHKYGIEALVQTNLGGQTSGWTDRRSHGYTPKCQFNN